MKFLAPIITVILIFQGTLFAQIAINNDNSSPDPSSMLDVKSTDKGMLIPRMTTLQRTGISSPAAGLLVFDNDTNGFWFFNGSSWNELSTGDVDWLRTNGNIATSINNSIYTNGNVGIGTSSPSFPLDVQGTGGERLRAYTTDGLFAGYISKNSTREFFAGVQATYETNDASSGYHIYDNTANSQRFVIDKDGDIGIGQANPNAKLHVNGDFRLVDGSQGAGKFLTSDASGFASWVVLTDNVDDADADPTNEIELPSGGTDGQVLSTNGEGSYSWVTDNADNLGNHTATQNVQLGTNHISNDGTANGIYIDANNNIGLGTATPMTTLDVSGTIVAGALAPVNASTLLGGEGIIMPGTISDYLVSVQDGNGRVQHKWNASLGINETYLIGAEDAAFIDLGVSAATANDAWIEFKHADGASAVAGDPISWNTHMIINQGGEVGINETSPDDLLHVTSGGNGTRMRAENTGNGWAGIVAKNSLREIFLGVQGAFDPNPGEFHIYDNTAGARRLVIDATGEVGIGKNNPSVKLDVNGSVNCTGGTCSSDIRWKRDIRPLENALENVLRLRGVSYDWRTAEFPDRDFSEDRQIGLIAQEVEEIYPELIKTDNEGYKSMDYMSLTAILLESVKALKIENDQQSAYNQMLESELKKLLTKVEKLELQNERIDRLEAMLKSDSNSFEQASLDHK